MESLTAFAPFMGLGRRATKPKASEEDPKAKAAEGGEDPKAEGEEDEKAKAKAEEDTKAKAAEGDEDPEADGEEDTNPAMEGKAARAARLAERQRIAAILNHDKAATNPGVAMNLAFKTDLNVKAAHAVLDGGEGKAKAGLQDRMRGMDAVRPGPGTPNQQGGPAAIQSGWATAYEKLKPTR